MNGWTPCVLTWTQQSLRVGDRHAAARHARNVGVYLTEEALA